MANTTKTEAEPNKTANQNSARSPSSQGLSVLGISNPSC